MGFFEYLSNNLLYLFIVIGAIILVIGGSIAKYFILKKMKKKDEKKLTCLEIDEKDLQSDDSDEEKDNQTIDE